MEIGYWSFNKEGIQISQVAHALLKQYEIANTQIVFLNIHVTI